MTSRSMLLTIAATSRTQQMTFAFGYSLGEKRELRAPEPVGVEGDVIGGQFAVERLEDLAQQRLTLPVLNIDRTLVAHAHCPQHRLDERADGPGHAGTKLRVLSQQGRQQSRSGARQAGDEMDVVHVVVSPKVGIIYQMVSPCALIRPNACRLWLLPTASPLCLTAARAGGSRRRFPSSRRSAAPEFVRSSGGAGGHRRAVAEDRWSDPRWRVG